MSRVLFLSIAESTALDHCKSHSIGVSASEPLPAGGTRLVCMSSEGAIKARSTLKSKIMKTEGVRAKHRPTSPLW